MLLRVLNLFNEEDREAFNTIHWEKIENTPLSHFMIHSDDINTISELYEQRYKYHYDITKSDRFYRPSVISIDPNTIVSYAYDGYGRVNFVIVNEMYVSTVYKFHYIEKYNRPIKVEIFSGNSTMVLNLRK